MPSNKYRVSVAGFSRDGISNNTSLDDTYGPAMYHWGIWVEPKNSDGDGPGRLYHVEERETMNSINGPIPGGWTFSFRDSDSRYSRRLVGRILIGKLPPGKGFPEIEALLDQVKRPADGSAEDCIHWTKNAIRLLQSQGPPPWAEEFDVEKFMEHAHGVIKTWYSSAPGKFKERKESYVGRKF